MYAFCCEYGHQRCSLRCCRRARELSTGLTNVDNQNGIVHAEPKGSVQSTCVLLASSGLGSGMLTLPKAVQQAGPVATIILLVVGVVLSIFSTVALLFACPRLQAGTYGVVIEKA